MTGAGNISDGQNGSGKVLCSQMSHGSVSIWTTAGLNYDDVKANVTQIVVYWSVHVGATGCDGVGWYFVALQDTTCDYWGKSDFQAVYWLGIRTICGAITSKLRRRNAVSTIQRQPSFSKTYKILSWTKKCACVILAGFLSWSESHRTSLGPAKTSCVWRQTTHR